mgnify:CR=1 FL=1
MLLASLLPYMGVGLLAQMVDGALGMAYGVTSSTLLLYMGMAPAVVSASVHAAEVATTGVSGVSHGFFGNVDRTLLRRLALPGALGGIVGAYFLSNIDVPWLRPFVAAYLLALGLFLLWRAWKNRRPALLSQPTRTGRLAVVAGFLDAVGGGGWGSLTTTSLIAQNLPPRIAIGTANAAEFFVSLAISLVFLATLGVSHTEVVLGLLLGGVVAAPFAAWLAKHMPARLTTGLVGGLVVVLSLVNIWKSLAG